MEEVIPAMRNRPSTRANFVPARKKPAEVKPIPTRRKTLATKVEEELKAITNPRPKLRLIGSSDKKTEPELSSPLSEVNEVELKEKKLTVEYYKKVAAEASVRWLTLAELKGVPAGIMAKWIHAPMKNHHAGRLGLTRQNGEVSHVTSWAQNPVTRKSLTAWDENVCEYLAAPFKEMITLRATISRVQELLRAQKPIQDDGRKIC
ncbi:hypothetical protein EG329_005695 [Mollisiaceae sp. DMI_Dod_QoI]|nr:hypothetical protein EG329_005695 [Helotiales sp. DMI_Dod_QoI]